MAVSITQRPAAWSPVNNPVVYKFSTTGGPFTNYRIEVEVFAGGVSVGAIFSFTPNSSNVTTADISAILKSILYRDWELPVSINESEDGIGSTEFYIKYQELYTGSATSQTSDSANTKVGVLAGLQIGSNADLDLYVAEDSTKKFLTIFDTPKIWIGYPFTISYLHPDNDHLKFNYEEFDIEGNTISSSSQYLSDENGLCRILIPDPNSSANTISIDLSDDNLVLGAPSSWIDLVTAFDTKNATQFIKASMASFPTSYRAYKSVSIPIGAGTPVDFDVTVDVANISAGSIVITFELSNSGSTNVIWSGITSSITSNGTFVRTIAWSRLVPDEHIDALSITVAKIGAGTPPDVTVTIPVNHLLIEFKVTETKTIQVKSACKNPVYLFWKNSLGGDSFYMFFFGQEDYFTYDNGRKARRQVLYAEGLSYNEWEAINELNTPGERYQVAIPELTTSVDKTGKRTDQQVYVVDTDGNKTGVIVIPRSTSARTDKKIHSISIEIEYPTIFL